MVSASLKHILYVEDDPDIQTVAQIALEVVGGFSLTICSSGAAALAEVHGNCRPDLLLLDVMMPNMDGPTTLLELRNIVATSNTPVVFMTAKVQSSEVELYKSLGAIGVIAKPFDPMELSAQVLKLWQERA
ncbi:MULTISPECIES: response regulator [unclassified Undibacterium]|uniref:response regulator n=1 Tax=unclassified Undibacterium TaxID=2630295 RepID=UPI002AC8D0F3|nr:MULTISPECIES: response regulator [unclassified Undibacterium]MEB0139641.1 response regulator [Undibacterium sp. CCC2.1]MEB0171997.1 response regulator [Undibacterium sp. CCC1.1]MEB0176310.1 response regulator [Undibacterium sp. CCC3.4]MEB0213992.1 response regulator [Undibacterium sp. 5I2]WPX43608.1 response regulator [Undibacterium sp. CCC3.4]